MAKRRSEANESIAIIQQNSIAEEEFSTQGERKKVHLVSKNIPFNIIISSTMPEKPVHCDLVFDVDQNSKVVVFGQEVLNYIATQKSKKIDLEIKVFILSSQNSNALFRIKIWQTSDEGENVVVYSHPIKVLSKKSQVLKIVNKDKDNKTPAQKKKRCQWSKAQTTSY